MAVQHERRVSAGAVREALDLEMEVLAHVRRARDGEDGRLDYVRQAYLQQMTRVLILIDMLEARGFKLPPQVEEGVES